MDTISDIKDRRRPEPDFTDRLDRRAWRRIARQHHQTGDDRDLYQQHHALMVAAGWFW